MYMTFLTDPSLYFYKAGPPENVSNMDLIKALCLNSAMHGLAALRPVNRGRSAQLQIFLSK